MLRHLASAERLVPPLHLDEVNLAIQFNHTVDLLDDTLAGRYDARECLPHQYASGLEQLVEHVFNLFAAFLWVSQAEQRIQVFLYLFQLRLPLVLGADLSLLLLKPLLPLRLLLLSHPPERIFHVHDAPDFCGQSFGFQLVSRPASGEILELNDSLQNLAPLPQARLALIVEPNKDLADDFILVHAAAVSSELLPEILRNRSRYSCTLEEYEHVVLAAAQERNRID